MFGFGKALDVLRDGDSVVRASWTHPEVVFGYPARIMLMKASVIPADAEDVGQGARRALFREHLALITPRLDEDAVEPWTPTHADLLAEDWDYAR